MRRVRESTQNILDRVKANVKEIATRKARSSLLGYIQMTFPGGFVTNWHHEIVCNEIDHWLDADEPYNLMLSMPPRHSKSEICSRHLPGYILGKNPDAQIIAASYAADLIMGMSRHCQRTMASIEHATLFPKGTVGRLASVQDPLSVSRADEFTIPGRKGHYLCAGIGGGITGHGADYGIIDDPVKDRQDAESKNIRERTVEWYTSVFRTRIHKGGRILLLMTRWHMDDLAGWAIKKMKSDPKADHWKVISFPATYEKGEWTHPDDPRKEGEVLWPAQKDAKELEQIRATIGSYDFEGLYQQRPQPPGGSRIKRPWLQVIERASLPDGLTWVRFWDLAVTHSTKADFTASGMMAIDQYRNIYVKGFIHEQQEWPVVKRMFIQQAVTDQVAVGIETSGTQKGFFDDLLTEDELQGIAVYGYSPDSSKLVRAQPWIARAEAGKFFLVHGPGVDDCIDELVEFTGMNDTHDDQVDWISGAYHMFAQDTEVEVDIVGDYEID